MTMIIFDATVEYTEKEKDETHDISVHLSPKAPRKGRVEKRKRRVRTTRRRWTGRYLKKSGGFASRAYAQRYPHLVKRQYKKVTGYRVIEETVTIPGAAWTDRDAFKAFWTAHKIVQRGGDLERDLHAWKVEAIDWRRGKNAYHYGEETAAAALQAMGGILEDDDTAIRVGLIDRVAPE